LGSYFLVSF
ncbi:hypothetical protein BVRB_037950, partial [Beta vulgaris subsp. vulgaris]